MPVIEHKGGLPAIRVETHAGRISGIEVDGHRLRGVVDVTIGDGSGSNPPAIFIQLRGRLEFAEAQVIQPSPTPKNGTV